ncbi:MAG: amidohydrolase family protein [Acidobacteria bacterium]|nr:amidohydrolase family protein [Acidobacteriota bacterium]
MSEKMWSNSGDSHFIEKPGLWHDFLPKAMADRMPRSERVNDDEEIIHVDGKTFTRALPKLSKKKDAQGRTIGDLVMAAPGARDLDLRMKDLDDEGIWAEIVFSSLGLWENLIEDRELIRAAARAENEYKATEIKGLAPDRLVPVATLPLLSVADAVAEVEHAASIGLHCIGLPTGVPDGVADYHRDDWEPLWAAAEATGMVLAIHIGSDNNGKDNVVYTGPGGAVLNYVETTYGGQKAATKLVASGALDRHPDLKVLVAEGGATWVPQLADRMDEAYRQHGMFVRPTLSRLPSEILFDQVYASFQHDRSAPAALTAMDYQNVMWGSDYPHLEGTYGHSQKTLHELFDDVAAEPSHRMRIGAFKELFPHVSDPPAA